MDPQDLPAIPAGPERRETRGPRAGTDPLEPRGREARTVYRENGARLVPEGSEVEWEDLEVSVSPDPKGTLASQALLGRWVSKEFLDLRGQEGLRVSPGCQAYLAKMDHQDRQESEAHLENMVHTDRKEIQELPGHRVRNYESLVFIHLYYVLIITLGGS